MEFDRRKLEEACKIYKSPMVSPIGMVCMAYMAERVGVMCRQRILKTKSNNWLKMHGYPMKRKGR